MAIPDYEYDAERGVFVAVPPKAENPNGQEIVPELEGYVPGSYSSKWKEQIDKLYSEINNRGPFQFDFNGDAMARNLRDQAIIGGQRAMADTLAKASAMTGGQLSSYSQAAGQQQYNRYLQDLNGQMMGLAQLAMERWDKEGDDLRDRLGYLEGQDAKDYDRWRDKEAADRQAAQDAYDKEWREKEWQHMLDREAIDDAFREAAAAGGGGGYRSSGGRGGGGGGGGGSYSGGGYDYSSDYDDYGEDSYYEPPEYENFSPWDNPSGSIFDDYGSGSLSNDFSNITYNPPSFEDSVHSTANQALEAIKRKQKAKDKIKNGFKRPW